MKKIVTYETVFPTLLTVGYSAIVKPKNHSSPMVTNTKEVLTSAVIRVEANGEFETQNTIYVPYELPTPI